MNTSPAMSRSPMNTALATRASLSAIQCSFIAAPAAKKPSDNDSMIAPLTKASARNPHGFGSNAIARNMEAAAFESNGKGEGQG